MGSISNYSAKQEKPLASPFVGGAGKDGKSEGLKTGTRADI
jgi:hypothetical protein